MVQITFGYGLRMVLLDVFFDFYNKLYDLRNTAKLTFKTERNLLSLMDEIHLKFLLSRKEEIVKRTTGFWIVKKQTKRSNGLYL